MDILYDKVEKPRIHQDYRPVNLTRETMEEHYRNVLTGMKEQNLDVLMIYADREHGANFAYLTGFEPRFEEAVLVLHADGRVYFLLGNENLNKAGKARFDCKSVHVSLFSLPNQPNRNEKSLEELMRDDPAESYQQEQEAKMEGMTW